MFWLGFIAGFIIGGFLGILIISCLVVGKRADEKTERRVYDDIK